MSDLTLKFLCDTREPWPHPWAEWLPDGCGLERATIETGDWCVAGAKDGVVIERKTASDFLGTITAGRERWEKELRRARLDCRELVVVVEASFPVVNAKRGMMSEESLIGTVAGLARRGVPVVFAGSIEAAARIAFAALAQPVKSADKALRSVRWQAKRKANGKDGEKEKMNLNIKEQATENTGAEAVEKWNTRSQANAQDHGHLPAKGDDE